MVMYFCKIDDTMVKLAVSFPTKVTQHYRRYYTLIPPNVIGGEWIIVIAKVSGQEIATHTIGGIVVQCMNPTNSTHSVLVRRQR